jgi:hypothetical protein
MASPQTPSSALPATPYSRWERTKEVLLIVMIWAAILVGVGASLAFWLTHGSSSPARSVALFQPDLSKTNQLTIPVTVVSKDPLRVSLVISDAYGNELVRSRLGRQPNGDAKYHYDVGSRLVPGAYKVTIVGRNIDTKTGAVGQTRVRSGAQTILVEGPVKTQVVSTVAAAEMPLVYEGCAQGVAKAIKHLNALGLNASFFCTAAELKADPQLAVRIVSDGFTLGALIDDSCPTAMCLQAQTDELISVNKMLVRSFGVSTLPFAAIKSTRPSGEAVDPGAVYSLGQAGYSYALTPLVLPTDTSVADLHGGQPLVVPWATADGVLNLVAHTEFKHTSLAVLLAPTTPGP